MRAPLRAARRAAARGVSDLSDSQKQSLTAPRHGCIMAVGASKTLVGLRCTKGAVSKGIALFAVKTLASLARKRARALRTRPPGGAAPRSLRQRRRAARVLAPPCLRWHGARRAAQRCRLLTPGTESPLRSERPPPFPFPHSGGAAGASPIAAARRGFWLGIAAPNALARPRGMHTKLEFCITRSTLRRQAPCLNSTGLALRVTRPSRRFCRALRVSPATFCGGAGWCSQACAPQKAGPTTRYGYKI